MFAKRESIYDIIQHLSAINCTHVNTDVDYQTITVKSDYAFMPDLELVWHKYRG